MRNRNWTAKGLTLSGTLLALAMVFLYGASIIPGIELTLFLAASLLVSAVIIEIGPAAGWTFYAASAFLGFLLIPNKAALFPYVLFFGVYGVLKFHIETLHRLTLEIVLKLVYFNLTFGMGFFLFRELLFRSIAIPDFPDTILLLLANGFFLFYDSVYTQIISFYLKRIHSQLR